MATERTMEGGPRGYRPRTASSTSCSSRTARRAPTPPRSSRPRAARAASGSPPPGAAATRSSCSRGSRSRRPARTGPSRDRPFPLDLVPRVLPAASGRDIKRGLAQRIRALNHFVDDVYHGREIVRDGIVPWKLVVSPPAASRAPCTASARRAASTATSPAATSCATPTARWQVLEDNVRTPSGISYVLENRVAMTRLVPQLFARYRVRAGRPLPAAAARRAALGRAVAPTARRRSSSGRRARSTPPTSSTRSSPARWASSWSRRRDLVVRDDVLYMRTTRGPSSACTRSTAASTTTSSTRSSSAPTRCSACPGLVRAYRAGHGRDRQRVRHRRRRRQGRLPLRAGDDPLLPRRGAAARERPDLPAGRPRAARVRARPRSTSSSSSRPASRAARACSSARGADEEELEGLADVVRARPGALDRAGGRQPLDRPDRRRGRRRSRRATSTCARSRSSARTSASSPAASRASRCEEGSMIVNSSRGGGSKDTWVLDERRPRRARRPRRSRRRSRRRCPTCATALDRPGTAAAAAARADARPDRPRALLARAQPRARRAHRAHARRRLPAELQGAARRARRACASAGSAARRDHGVDVGRAPASAATTRCAADARPDEPASVRAASSARATRARDGARRHLRRDVGGDQHDRPRAARPRRSDGAPARGPVLGVAVRQGALRAVLGAHGDARCCATRRSAFLAPAAAIEVGRHGAADAARRAAADQRDERPRDGQALALLQAVGGFQAFRRAVPAPPNACPVARFLLFERAYPDSVAASVDALHEALLDADAPAQLRARAAPQPAGADLEFRTRTPSAAATCATSCEQSSSELAARRPATSRPLLRRRASARPHGGHR